MIHAGDPGLIRRGMRGSKRESRERLRQILLQPDSISMAFQPIVRLADDHVVGVEALARFPAAGGLSASMCFQLAQTSGLRRELEMLSVQKAMETLPELPPEQFLSVNLSPYVVCSPAFAGWADRTGLDRIFIEVTEQTLAFEPPVLVDRLAQVRERGARIALDDIGSGFLSLEHMVRLEPEMLKADRSLVEGIEHQGAQRALLRSLAAFAEETGAWLVAEGVETLAQRDAVRQLGVPFAQGFLWSRPVPSLETLSLNAS